jgi:hypothetical protein
MLAELSFRECLADYVRKLKNFKVYSGEGLQSSHFLLAALMVSCPYPSLFLAWMAVFRRRKSRSRVAEDPLQLK